MKRLLFSISAFLILLGFSGCGDDENQQDSVKKASAVESSQGLISPYGKFNFGDTFTPTWEKICSMKNITQIGVGWGNEETKDNFCSTKEVALALIKKTMDFEGIMQVNKEGFEDVGFIAPLTISLQNVNIKGVDFVVNIIMGQQEADLSIGSYILTKDDTFKFGKYYVPLQIERVNLKPVNKDDLKANKKEIYSILKDKYGSLIKDMETSDKYFNINVSDEMKRQFEFNNEGMEYSSYTRYKLYKDAYKDYLKNKPKNTKNESSGDL